MQSTAAKKFYEIGDAIMGEASIEWNIGDFFSLSKKVDDFYDSHVFSFNGSEWFMRMYPNGETSSSSSGWVSLYLWRKDLLGQPKIVYFTVGIKGSKGVEEMVPGEMRWEFSEENGLGCGCFKTWSRSHLRKRKSVLLPSNMLTVVFDLRSNSFSSNNSEKKVLKSLRNVLESGDDSDVVMKVQGKEFPAHRVILRARSPVFRSMFLHDTVEKKNNVVTIKEFDPATFLDFLVHIYSGSCEQISASNVFSLFSAADKYDIGELKVACADFMERNLSVACFCDVIALAVKHNEETLIESATKFFCSNSLGIVKTSEWRTFLQENFTVGNELIIKALSKAI